jgi:hypothetical protein
VWVSSAINGNFCGWCAWGGKTIHDTAKPWMPISHNGHEHNNAFQYFSSSLSVTIRTSQGYVIPRLNGRRSVTSNPTTVFGLQWSTKPSASEASKMRPCYICNASRHLISETRTTYITGQKPSITTIFLYSIKFTATCFGSGINGHHHSAKVPTKSVQKTFTFCTVLVYVGDLNLKYRTNHTISRNHTF